jgi:diguanylate cyclase
MNVRTPSEIAREALRLLGARKLAPTPASYAAAYQEVEGNTRADAPHAPADDLRQHVARLIRASQAVFGMNEGAFAEFTGGLLEHLQSSSLDPAALNAALQAFTPRMETAARDQADIRDSLLQLLRLIIGSITELSLDDRWLQTQVDVLMTVAAPPLSVRRLDEVERRLKDLIEAQAKSKARAVQAQDEMREMLATFIQRLSDMGASSSSYHSSLEANARLIEQARSITDIAPALKEVMVATRTMAHDTLSARDELQGMRERAEVTEAELARLHEELDRVSAQARHDALTGALNRKGLDEALERELAQVRRKNSPLCLALLDLDDFKKLNDRLGHATGDAALAHLASVAREVMRPQDTLARYGGEEFVILLPDTALESGIEAMTRFQRELSRRFFLTGSQKILITFSAGVAQLAEHENGHDAIGRADHAMYLAKKAGKNRVLGT